MMAKTLFTKRPSVLPSIVRVQFLPAIYRFVKRDATKNGCVELFTATDSDRFPESVLGTPVIQSWNAKLSGSGMSVSNIFLGSRKNYRLVEWPLALMQLSKAAALLPGPARMALRSHSVASWLKLPVVLLSLGRDIGRLAAHPAKKSISAANNSIFMRHPLSLVLTCLTCGARYNNPAKSSPSWL